MSSLAPSTTPSTTPSPASSNSQSLNTQSLTDSPRSVPAPPSVSPSISLMTPDHLSPDHLSRDPLAPDPLVPNPITLVSPLLTNFQSALLDPNFTPDRYDLTRLHPSSDSALLAHPGATMASVIRDLSRLSRILFDPNRVPPPSSDNPQSEIFNLQSDIFNPQSAIPNPQSDISNPHALSPSLSQISNLKSEIDSPQSDIFNPQSAIRGSPLIPSRLPSSTTLPPLFPSQPRWLDLGVSICRIFFENPGNADLLIGASLPPTSPPHAPPASNFHPALCPQRDMGNSLDLLSAFSCPLPLCVMFFLRHFAAPPCLVFSWRALLLSFFA